MSKIRRYLSIYLFLFLCIATILFLRIFTQSESPIAGDIVWDTCEIADDGGSARPFDPAEIPELREGEYFRFTGKVPDSVPDSYLLFEIGGAGITLFLDGEECYCSLCPDSGQDMTFEQVHIPIPEGAAGRTLTMHYVPLGGEQYLFPPYIRITSDAVRSASAISAANLYSFPVGACALGFVMIFGIFLAGLAAGSPDWSLPVLALVAAFTAFWQIGKSISGAYFLPNRLTHFLLSSNYLAMIPPLLCLLYLFLNRRRSFWRLLGWITAFAGPVLAVWFLLELAAGNPVALGTAYTLLHPVEYRIQLSGVLNYFDYYILAACGSIALYNLIRTQIQMQNEAGTLALKNRMIMDNYHAIEQSARQTASLRHEWKNEITALHLLWQRGETERLEEKLAQLDQQLDRLSTAEYSKHPTVNMILQNIAVRAQEEGIGFHASAPLPAELAVDESDLCSLLFNLLENALTAAGRMQSGAREIACSIQLKKGYLAVKCENTYDGNLSRGEHGELLSTRENSSEHGFGIMQMKKIAKKYGSALDISYTADRFTVQTALKLPSSP